MEQAYDYLQEDGHKTKLWATEKAEKEMDKWVEPDLAAHLLGWAEKGFQGYEGSWLRWEGDGVWAFGTKTWTTRIAGFFVDDKTRADFVICGVWYGKSGKGGGRPQMGDTVAARVAALKREGVVRVRKEEVAEGEGEGAEVSA